jgi:hypothetical protein
MSLVQITGLERLACEIVKQAVIDSKNGDISAKVFLKGLWFETLCEIIKTDPDLIRQKIKS